MEHRNHKHIKSKMYISPINSYWSQQVHEIVVNCKYMFQLNLKGETNYENLNKHKNASGSIC